MWRKFLAVLRDAPPGTVLWDLGKWVFAGAASICAIIVALINGLAWVYTLPLIIACGIIFSFVTWTAISSVRRFVPEPAIPFDAALRELKELCGEVDHIFYLGLLSLLAEPLDALRRVTELTKRGRAIIRREIFRDHISANDLNRYDTPYNEDDLINIEKEYEKKGYLEKVDEVGRALFRHLYERRKRLDEALARISRPQSVPAGADDRTPVTLTVAELKGLLDEGNVMLGTFRGEEPYGTRPTPLDAEAYAKRLQAAVRRRVLEVGSKEAAAFEQPWLPVNMADIERHQVVRKDLSEDETQAFDRLVDRVERLKQVVSTIEKREVR